MRSVKWRGVKAVRISLAAGGRQRKSEGIVVARISGPARKVTIYRHGRGKALRMRMREYRSVEALRGRIGDDVDYLVGLPAAAAGVPCRRHDAYLRATLQGREFSGQLGRYSWAAGFSRTTLMPEIETTATNGRLVSLRMRIIFSLFWMNVSAICCPVIFV